jgi:hypothetical protein
MPQIIIPAKLYTDQFPKFKLYRNPNTVYRSYKCAATETEFDSPDKLIAFLKDAKHHKAEIISVAHALEQAIKTSPYTDYILRHGVWYVKHDVHIVPTTLGDVWMEICNAMEHIDDHSIYMNWARKKYPEETKEYTDEELHPLNPDNDVFGIEYKENAQIILNEFTTKYMISGCGQDIPGIILGHILSNYNYNVQNFIDYGGLDYALTSMYFCACRL